MSKLRQLIFTLFAVTVFGLSQTVIAADATKATTETKQSVVSGKININSADAETLHNIKGFGMKKAQAIISYRTKNGDFKSVDDLLKVKSRGLNKKWLNKVSKWLEV